ncbi:MAG: flagellar filament capping protein FliD [Oceanospirillaceae bacterium]|nr:flagellar filament capping protein FliD [Oceanospirillaceae bacterium]
MAITSTGFGSGLPISDLVSQLVSAEGAPVQNRLDSREARLQTELSAVSILKSALADFQSSLAQLADVDNFTSRSASSSNSEIASISAEENAGLGSYSLEVTSLATAHKLVGQQGYTDGGTGSLSFSNAAGDSFTVNIGDEDATLEGIRDAINNADDNFGVTATILNLASGPRLVLTADDTGADNRITSISSTSTNGDLSVFDYDFAAAVDGDDANYDQVTAAADAIFSLEGQALTSASNRVDSVISGVTLTLKDATETGKPVTLTVGTNTINAKTMIEGFVEAYNELQSLIAQQTAYDPDSGRAGALQGDALTRSVQGQLRTLLSGSYNEGGGITALANLGITTTRSGSLEIDSSKLTAALADNFADINAFFSTEETGFASRLDAMLETYLQSNGTFDSRTDSINSQLDRIDDDRESLALRLEKLETRLLNQFNAMDAVVAQLGSTGNFLTQQLASISQIQNFRNSNNS